MPTQDQLERAKQYLAKIERIADEIKLLAHIEGIDNQELAIYSKAMRIESLAAIARRGCLS